LRSIVVLVLALAACGRPGIPENRTIVLVTLDRMGGSAHAARRPVQVHPRADPAEERDLVNVESGRAADMAGELNAWVAATTEASAEAASHRALDATHP